MPDGPRILILDIETSPDLAWVWGLFNQNIAINQIEMVGSILCFAAKWHDSKEVMFFSDFDDGHDQMILQAHALLDEADIVVHWNGTRFDIPWLRREFLLAKLAPPSPFKEVDLCLASRKTFRFSSNKLDHVAQMLGVGGKVSTGGFDLWLGCMGGDPKAWSKMRRYNINDVKITAKVYDRLLPHLPKHPHLGLYSGERGVCGRCKSKNLEKRGFAYTDLGKFQQYRCKDCGTWTRSGKRIDGVDLRPVA